MARGNDLKLTPTHNKQFPPLTSISPGGHTDPGGPDILSDEVEFFSGPEGNDYLEIRPEEGPKAQIEARDPQHDDQQDEDVAEGFAGLINNASLSGMSHQSPAIDSKAPERNWGILTKLFGRTPHKEPDNSQESTNAKLEKELRRGLEQALQSTEQMILTGTKEVSSLIGLESEAINPTKKPQVSERPNVYDTPQSPQSPPRSPGTGTKANNDRKRKIPKPKRLLVRDRAKNAELQANEDVFLDAFDAAEQEHVEVAEHARALPTKDASPITEQVVSPRRMNRASGAKGRKGIAQSQKSEQSAPQLLEGSPVLAQSSMSQAVKPKAKRGRPRKDQNGRNHPQSLPTNSAVTSDTLAHFDIDTMRRNDTIGGYEVLQRDTGERVRIRATAESGGVAGEDEIAEQDLGEVNNILMSPSPIKEAQQPPPPTQTKKLKRPSSAIKDLQGGKKGQSSQYTSKTHQEPGLSRSKYPEVHRTMARKYQREALSSNENYESSGDDDDSSIHEPDVSSVNASQPNEDLRAKATSFFINEQVMDEILSSIKKVRHGSRESMVVSNKEFKTAIGRRMSKAAEKLADTYILVEELRSADEVDLQKVQVQQQRASVLLERLESLMSTTLNGQRNREVTFRTKMLLDLYSYIIPETVDALYISARWYWKQPPPDTVELEEFTALLKALFELVRRALAEDEAVQPKASDSPHKFVKPTAKFLKIVGKLLRKCSEEVRVREARKTAPERARKRKKRLEEQQQADEEDYLRRLKERNIAILISLNKSRARLGLPPSSHQDEARTSNPPHWDNASSEEFSNQSDDAEHERLSLFGRNNSHPEKIPREWTREEMEVLVDVLWQERGPTRYETLAMRLDRTMDEIFERAKYFKQQVQYTINRKQEENPAVEHAKMEPWVENIGHEF